MVPMLESQFSRPVITVDIQGKPYRFVLDTGAQTGVFSDALAKKLGLMPIGKASAQDPSGTNARSLSIYRVAEMHVGTVVIKGAIMVADDPAKLKQIDSTLDGVLSYQAFHDVILTLDYPKRQVVISSTPMTDQQSHHAIGYETEHGIINLPVKIGTFSVTGQLDSGANGGLSIPSTKRDQVKFAAPLKLVRQGRTLFNAVDVYGAPVSDPVFVGGIQMPSQDVELNFFPYANIGSKLLNHYRITIDQRKNKLVFE